MSERLDQAFWERRWEQVCDAHAAVVRDWPPNPRLVAEAEGLPPGTALDAGCGHGVDAIWLASGGWTVTAVDFADTALRRARERASTLGSEVASRIDWIRADLGTWTPPEQRFDLVSSHYVHGAARRDTLFRRLATSVAPDGRLLIVGHHPSDRHAAGPHALAPEVYFTAEEVAAILDPDRWDIAVAETRPRSAIGPDGHETTMHDAVLRARRRPARAPSRAPRLGTVDGG